MAHLHLGILVYWLVNTVRFQIKQQKINHNWQEIVRITNTQKVITTSGQNKDDEIIYVRRCTEPNEKVKQIVGMVIFFFTGLFLLGGWKTLSIIVINLLNNSYKPSQSL